MVKPIVCRLRSSAVSSEIPEWQEIRENLVDEGVPEHRDSHDRSMFGARTQEK